MDPNQQPSSTSANNNTPSTSLPQSPTSTPVTPMSSPAAEAPTPVIPPPQMPSAQPLDRTTLPPELKGFNWGALILSWIWGIGNRVWISLLALLPGANLVMAIILGIMGNELAWKAKQWDSIEHFKTVQRKWKIAGIIYFVVMMVILLLLFILIMAGMSTEKSTSTQVTTSTTSNGTKVTTLQQIPNGYKEYKTNCYMSVLADPSKIREENCGMDATTTDSTLPYVTVYAITDSDDAATGARKFLDNIKQKAGSDSYIKSDTIVVNSSDAVGDNIKATSASWTRGAFKYKDYFVDAPFGSSKKASNGKVIKYYMISGFNNNPDTDIFTKNFQMFIQNFKLR